jgi:predicted ATPase
MKIQIQNLGPIKQGEVDLSKHLIIFAGPNNTGKSHIAYLIYGLYQNGSKINEDTILKIFASKKITPTIQIHSTDESPYSVYFFPAERTAINMLGKEIFREKAAQLDEISQQILKEEDVETIVKSLQQKNLIPRYPLAIRDYLNFINDLEYVSKHDSQLANFADEIETTLLHGKVLVSKYGDIKFLPKNSQQVLELHLSSSLVKSLAGLVLYFRHLATKGDTIIMDEPELNLHPDNQVIIARIFAKAVNQGINMILSTHSDYIIKELNNLIMLNKTSNEQITEFGYPAQNLVLNKDQIGAYFFSENKIEPIEVSDLGLSVKSIDTAINNLDNTMEHIYYQLFEKE